MYTMEADIMVFGVVISWIIISDFPAKQLVNE
jgi:ABC-type sulfate transport system permease component